MNKKLKLFLISIAIITAIGFTAFYFSKGKETTTPSTKEVNVQSAKNLQLRILSGMVYRHLAGYDLVCKEAGYPLKKYPEYFAQKYKTSIQKINDAWEADGKNLEDILIHFDKKIYPTIAHDIKKELIDIERLTAKYILAHQQKISVEKIEWTDELEKKLNLKDACLLLDDEAAFFLDQSAFDKEFNDRVKELD
ncbi:MAG: hypothetical protein IJY92_04885 [Alphaproteobacteria bacterium]|nr:hypothetical protein [Alphaproteobacteria bacterium]